MLKFNNNDLFTGFLKQLFVSFNLPTYYNGKWTGTDDPAYFYNKFLLNGARHYKINSNIYDSYTHEYLGDYLRFHQYFYGLDLMPLYNCFSNRTCNHLELNILADEDTKQEFTKCLSTDDKNYKIYMIPAKLDRKYTIAIDCNSNVEICCGLYSNHQVAPDEKDIKNVQFYNILLKNTYTKYNSLKFNQPIVFDKLIDNSIANEYIVSRETSLKMFIKLPIENDSSITILEGDYSSYNNEFNVGDVTRNSTNHSVINFEYEEAVSNFEPITDLQLLELNTGESYPFADRLIEYLLGNTINKTEYIRDNILRVQQVMRQNRIKFTANGVWDDKIQAELYTYMQSPEYNIRRRNHDILGYVDKDVEAVYKGNETLLNVDIYPDLYLDDKDGDR